MAKKSKQHTLKAKVAPAGHPPRELAALLQGERRCPVVHTTDGEVLVLGNAHAREVAEDADLYSSQVSTHLQLPNGLDGEDHARFRGLIERYLEPAAVEKREPEFRDVARDVIAEALPGLRAEVDAVADLGARYAVRAMTTWLGGPRDLEGRLFAWVKENAAATRSGDTARTAAVADEFDRIITTVLGPRLKEGAAHDDVTQQLITDTSLGRRLKKKEIVSVLRNWTGGDVSSMALCIGVILDRLAADTVLQEHLRFGVPDAEFTAIVDELLRLDREPRGGGDAGGAAGADPLDRGEPGSGGLLRPGRLRPGGQRGAQPRVGRRAARVPGQAAVDRGDPCLPQRTAGDGRGVAGGGGGDPGGAPDRRVGAAAGDPREAVTVYCSGGCWPPRWENWRSSSAKRAAMSAFSRSRSFFARYSSVLRPEVR